MPVVLDDKWNTAVEWAGQASHACPAPLAITPVPPFVDRMRVVEARKPAPERRARNPRILVRRELISDILQVDKQIKVASMAMKEAIDEIESAKAILLKLGEKLGRDNWQ